jgi:hypothetical protein
MKDERKTNTSKDVLLRIAYVSARIAIKDMSERTESKDKVYARNASADAG